MKPDDLACPGATAPRTGARESSSPGYLPQRADASRAPARQAAGNYPDTTTLFRPEVLNERRSQWLGTVLLTSSASQRLFALFALLAAAAVVALLVFADFTRKARVDGMLMPQQGLVRVASPRAGVVAGLHVEEGSEVAAGDSLVTVSTELQSSALGGTQAGIAAGLREQRESLASERRRREQMLGQQTQVLENRIAGMRDELAQMDEEIELLEARVALTERRMDLHRDLREKGYISKLDFQAIEAERLEQGTRLSALKRERIGLRRNLNDARTALDELPLQAETELAAIDREIAATERELAATEAQRELVITASQAGTVTAITAETGSHVDGSRPLLSIVPKGSELQARLYGASRTVGFLEPGQRVALRLQAYPYQKFGHQEGVITEISRSPLNPADLEPQFAAASNEPLYRITVALARQTVTAYGEELALQPGMQLEADIALETRPIYEWILDPLYTLTGRVAE